jgi:glucose dehydrogenase
LVEVSAGRLAAAGDDAQHWLMYGRDYGNQRFSPLAKSTEATRNSTRLELPDGTPDGFDALVVMV